MQYGKEDVGKQINLAVELLDIFNAFRREESDASNEREREPQAYTFGTQLKNTANTSFMVRAGGQIQVIISAKLTSKVKEYVSELRLEKTKNISESELLTLKVTTFKNEMEKKIEEQGAVIQKQGAEIAILKQNNTKVEKAN